MNVNSAKRIHYSMECAANQLRNENGARLQWVTYVRGAIQVHIADGKPAPAWLLERIDRLSKKYSEPEWQWFLEPEAERAQIARAEKPTVKRTWAELNGVLGEKVIGLRITKPAGSRRGQVVFLIGEGAQLVSPLDMLIQPYKYAKANHEQHSNAKQVKILVERLVVLFVKAVAKREKMRIADNKLEIEAWGDKLPLTVLYKNVGKEGLRVPDEKAEAKKGAKELAKVLRAERKRAQGEIVFDLADL